MLQHINKTPMPIGAAYKVRAVLKAAQEICDDFQSRRNSILQELGSEKPGDKNSFVFETPEIQEAFTNRITELLAEEVELECNPVPLSGLEGALKISAEGLELVEWMIDSDK